MSEQKKTSIADKIAKLDELVAWFDSEDFELEKAADTFKAAHMLANDIEHDLEELENTITVVSRQFDKAEE